MYSLLQKLRMHDKPRLPDALHDLASLTVQPDEKLRKGEGIESIFPNTKEQPIIYFKKKENHKKHTPLILGVVFSGGQASGGHNVIAGLFDALKLLNPHSALFGFVGGPAGILENRSIEITEDLLVPYRNQGGFDLIGSGRTKIETEEQFQTAERVVKDLKLDGLVIIGGDDSNTNAALLAEYFLARHVPTRVVGVPKTIDGDLKNAFIETSFGFDTAAKTFSDIIGNISRDTLSAKKYYYFIKLMGRTASHITLECALQTHPNLALIGEEIEEQKKSLKQITNEIADLICERAKIEKHYGIILVPEGIVEFIPEFKEMIKELNNLFAGTNTETPIDQLGSHDEKVNFVSSKLSKPSCECFLSIPREIQFQLLIDRDPHGNVQVSKIETERLLMETVRIELQNRQKKGEYRGKFNPQPLFCGYEGRSCMPSIFDSEYCYALGFVSALLVDAGLTGYMSCIRNLYQPTEDWKIAGIPLVSMMHFEQRHGKNKPVIRKSLVDLKGRPYKEFIKAREDWRLEDSYHYPGPIQFYGPAELIEAVTLTLEYESTTKNAFAQAGID